MKKFLWGFAGAALCASQPVLAADLSYYKAAPMPVAPSPVWSGFYFGANGGYGWGGADLVFPTSQFFADRAGEGFNPDPNGGIFGGHIGVNKQFGPWVLGVEGSIDWANLRQNAVGPVSRNFPNDSYSTKIDSLDTVTGRIGYAWNNWLLYGKIGVAWSRAELNIASGAPVPGVIANSSQILSGLTGGGGLEYMVLPNIVIGGEYNYANLGRETISTAGFCTLAACAGSGGTPVNINGSNVHVQSVVGRISYLFNWNGLPF